MALRKIIMVSLKFNGDFSVVTFVQDKVSHGHEVLLEFSLKAREITKT